MFLLIKLKETCLFIFNFFETVCHSSIRFRGSNVGNVISTTGFVFHALFGSWILCGPMKVSWNRVTLSPRLVSSNSNSKIIKGNVLSVNKNWTTCYLLLPYMDDIVCSISFVFFFSRFWFDSFILHLLFFRSLTLLKIKPVGEKSKNGGRQISVYTCTLCDVMTRTRLEEDYLETKQKKKNRTTGGPR